MLPEAVFKTVGNLPYMQLREARIFYDLICSNNLRKGLELGFFHGVSSTYLAGAFQDVGGGHLTTIDLLTAKERNPNIEELLQQTGLAELVRVFYEPKSFNWRLLELLHEGKQESFDFCYFDGAHTWYDTGFAFCIVDKLIAPGGWLVFDDLYFSFRESNNKDKPWVRRMPEAEQVAQQVRYVFELLVEANPSYSNFRRLSGRFAFAQKKHAGSKENDYLPQPLAIAVSYALERAHRDPEFRNDLLFAPGEAMQPFLHDSIYDPAVLTFSESTARGPLPVISHHDGTFTIPVERPVWDIMMSRDELLSILGEP